MTDTDSNYYYFTGSPEAQRPHQRRRANLELQCGHRYTYYNLEHDNWYCAACHCGMGDDYNRANRVRSQALYGATD